MFDAFVDRRFHLFEIFQMPLLATRYWPPKRAIRARWWPEATNLGVISPSIIDVFKAPRLRKLMRDKSGSTFEWSRK
jgi:hypothetical protein